MNEERRDCASWAGAMGAAFRARRIALRLSQTALGEKVSTSQSAVVRVEKTGPRTLLAVVRYCCALGLDLEELPTTRLHRRDEL